MRIELPVLKQEIQNGNIITNEIQVPFEIDTSVYSEERWEQNFPDLAAREGLFEYISRVKENGLTERVKVTALLKALFCFLEAKEIRSYKEFAQLFNLAAPEYTERLIATLKNAFDIILNGSSIKN